jgi:hypothetical protein
VTEHELKQHLLHAIKRLMLEYGEEVRGPADLLFHHRQLRCLVALDLKVAHFRPEYESDLQHRLNDLSEHMTHPEENRPAGILLCAEPTAEVARLLIPTCDPERAARYSPELPRTSQLRRWMHEERLRMKQRAGPGAMAPELLLR